MPANFASAAQSAGLEFARIEGLRQLFKEPPGVSFIRARQRMRNHHAGLAVHRPVNEHAESLVAKPLQPFGLVQRSGWDIALRRQQGTKEEETNSEASHDHVHYRRQRIGLWFMYHSLTAHDCPGHHRDNRLSAGIRGLFSCRQAKQQAQGSLLRRMVFQWRAIAARGRRTLGRNRPRLFPAGQSAPLCHPAVRLDRAGRGDVLPAHDYCQAILAAGRTTHRADRGYSSICRGHG